MRIEKERKLEFSDVFLIPSTVSCVQSRKDVDTSIQLGNRKLKLPLIASPMKDVMNGFYGRLLVELGCFGILHRFCSIEEQIKDFELNKSLGVAIGTNGDCLERYQRLTEVGCDLFCIDVANGASSIVEKTINDFLKIESNVQFIVGNVASGETYRWCASLPNVVGVRVGIAGGNACTTKNATGVYYPMASLIEECKEHKDHYDIPAAIMADGGVKEPSDFCKAIALGADCVIAGSIFASAVESPAELIEKDDKHYKIYHGSASFEIQKIYKEKPKYIEGRTALLEFNNESIAQIIDRFADGLKSSMSYFNSKTIFDFHNHATLCHK